jgi:hypothetical protein
MRRVSTINKTVTDQFKKAGGLLLKSRRAFDKKQASFY